MSSTMSQARPFLQLDSQNKKGGRAALILTHSQKQRCSSLPAAAVSSVTINSYRGEALRF